MINQAPVITLTETNFGSQVLETSQPVVVCFSADWSGSADIDNLIVDDLAAEFSGKVTFGNVDSDKHRQLAERMGVASIPTLLLFNRGLVVDMIEGIISRSELAEKIEAQLETGSDPRRSEWEAPAGESSAESTEGSKR